MRPPGPSNQQGDRLRVRDLAPGDIPLVNGYWANLTPSDLDRMSIDSNKIPKPYIDLVAHLRHSELPFEARKSEILIWDLNGRAVGVSTLRNIRFGTYGEIHLHMFSPEFRRLGYGHRFFAMALRECFRRFEPELIVCEPSSRNPGPNRLLQKLGFGIARTYRTVPGPLNHEHEVNRYEIAAALTATLPTT